LYRKVAEEQGLQSLLEEAGMKEAFLETHGFGFLLQQKEQPTEVAVGSLLEEQA
jgi:hypothetical protein